MRDAMAANTGISKAAAAVLLANSLKSTMKAHTANSIQTGLLPSSPCATWVPKTCEAPDAPSRSPRAKPPPNRINTPQSVCSDNCAHEVSLSQTTATKAASAKNVSGL